MRTPIESEAIKKLKNQVVCPVEVALRILGGKWRGSIIYQLQYGELKFNELKHRVQDAVIDYENADNYLSNKVLSSHLKELIEYGLVQKNIGTKKQDSTYALTETGIKLVPVLIELFYWGEHLMRLPNGNQTTQLEDLTLDY